MLEFAWLMSVGAAHSAVPAPDYRLELLARVELETHRLLESGKPQQALEHIQTFRKQVTDEPRLAYEESLVLRHLGRTADATQLLETTLSLDRTLAAAWYDLGELQLMDDKLETAKTSFQQAADLTVEHPQGWAGPYRLAEVAGFQNNPAEFEQHLEEALRRGFSMSRTIQGDPRWAAFMQQEALAVILIRLATVYGEESVLESLFPTPQENP
ncbi:MAG: hypothetical protein VX519_01435 [Myxococcota bacterium]|nr:hypothetical protein [Myxococcota bacterium]